MSEPPHPPLGGSDRLVAELTAWANEARADEAIDRRRRERWLDRQASEESSFAGVLVDLAERGEPVVVHTAAGRRHRGRIRLVTSDLAVMTDERGHDLLLRHRAMTSVRHGPESRAPRGDRVVVPTLTFAEAVAVLADDRPLVSITTRGDREPLRGELRMSGTDVVTVRLEGPGHPVASIPIDAVDELVVLAD